MWRLFKHWLQGATPKAYFCAVKVADLQLTGNDCVSHAPAGCSVLLAQPRGRHTDHIFHQKASAPALQPSECIFVSPASGFWCHKVTPRDSRSLFASDWYSHILAGCISITFDDRGSDCQLLSANPLKCTDCPSPSLCFHWFSLLMFALHVLHHTPHSSLPFSHSGYLGFGHPGLSLFLWR